MTADLDNIFRGERSGRLEVGHHGLIQYLPGFDVFDPAQSRGVILKSRLGTGTNRLGDRSGVPTAQANDPYAALADGRGNRGNSVVNQGGHDSPGFGAG
jgi:hypothetical protein